MQIAVEVLNHEEILEPHQMVIQLRQWSPSEQTLDDPFDIIVDRISNIGELKASLCEKLEGIPRECISVAKAYGYHLKDLENLPLSINWDVNNEVILTKTPWYLVDGELLIFKDSRIPEILPDGMTENDLKKSSGFGSRGNREVGITINTVYTEEGKKKIDALRGNTNEQEEE
eukprot:TRINITY_DN489_c0_g1_i10.p1 TRINITY_DN489_c0_g1~~TRINITY_DN489_c0_g1_i10.p1  ORF type:complete len:173 (+),score=45.98 TRINITY_DN489_c0_g1_i10:90-608(+)